MLILTVAASMNTPSNSEMLADAFIEGVRCVEGMQTTKVCLRDLSMEHFTLAHYDPACPMNDDFCKIQDMMKEAVGIVIATPIWNFSVPAQLKNCIDRMGAFALDAETHSKGQLKGKPFFIIYTGGAPLIAWKALMYITTVHVTEAIKYYGGLVVGKHFEPKCIKGKGQFGCIVQDRSESLAKMRARGARFASVAKQYAETGQLPLSIRLRYSFFTWAYRIGNRIMYPISARQ